MCTYSERRRDAESWGKYGNTMDKISERGSGTTQEEVLKARGIWEIFRLILFHLFQKRGKSLSVCSLRLVIQCLGLNIF